MVVIVWWNLVFILFIWWTSFWVGKFSLSYIFRAFNSLIFGVYSKTINLSSKRICQNGFGMWWAGLWLNVKNILFWTQCTIGILNCFHIIYHYIIKDWSIIHKLLGWFLWNLYQVVQLQFVGLQGKGQFYLNDFKSKDGRKLDMLV